MSEHTTHTSTRQTATHSRISGDKLNTQDAEVRSMVAKVRDDKDDTTWCLFRYNGSKNELIADEAGSGGVDQMVGELDPGKAMFGLLRKDVKGYAKFIMITWCPDGVPSQRRGLVHAHSKVVASELFPFMHMQINAREESDFDDDEIDKKLQRAAGSAMT